ncbi:MAG: 2-phosphosulfolactate phosphatase [Cytophagales bacterium]|nr:2-phosphosulfolactate phosphatase [Cytophagales bacterium]
MKKVEVCLSPELIHLYDIKEKLVIVVDVLRATSSMVTAFAYGVKKIIPVTTLKECKKWQAAGYLATAERDGQKVEGFDLDNSPLSYRRKDLQGRTIAMTTTNGTMAIKRANTARKIIIGAFLNLAAVANYCLQQQDDVVILCAGWRGKVNMEDTLFAGALVESIKHQFELGDDSSQVSYSLYRFTKGSLLNCIVNASPSSYERRNSEIIEDITFCLKLNQYEVIPVLEGTILQQLF